MKIHCVIGFEITEDEENDDEMDLINQEEKIWDYIH